MASPAMQQAILTVQDRPSTDKTEVAVALAQLLSPDSLQSISSSETISHDLKAFVDTLFQSQLGIVGTRQVLTTLLATLNRVNQPDLTIEVGRHVLSLLAAQPSTYIEQSAQLRISIATALEENEDWAEAARVLAEVPLDSSQRKVTDEERCEVWIRIVRNYLEMDDTTSAESYLNKVKIFQHSVENTTLQLHFKLSQARIQDAKRAFLPASQVYHDISYSPLIPEEERLRTLSSAIKCAILAPAGPSRSRALGTLFKDDRSASCSEFGMLEKMLFDRLITPDERDKFSEELAPHQRALTADGSTVLEKAVVEHNLLGASRLYSNIRFDALGALLNLSPVDAEITTARMIEQGRLVGRIDQIDELIWFEGGEASGEKGSGKAEEVVGKEMRRWDVNVQGLAEELENVTNALQREFPEFVAANLVV